MKMAYNNEFADCFSRQNLNNHKMRIFMEQMMGFIYEIFIKLHQLKSLMNKTQMIMFFLNTGFR